MLPVHLETVQFHMTNSIDKASLPVRALNRPFVSCQA